MMCLLAPVVLALAADAYAPPRVDLGNLLAKPISPGTIALLVPHLPEPRAVDRVIAGISHSDPAVRAIAARIAGVTGLPALSRVRAALQTETDRSAATEQLRASVCLGPPADDLALLPVARRHALVDVLAVTMAAVRGPAALASLDAFVEAGLREAADSEFVAVATRGGQEGLNLAGTSALRTSSIARWSTVLTLARHQGRDLPSDLLVASIGSALPGIRALTYWHVVVTTPAAATLSTDIESAIARTADSGPDADDGARFALVVLRRVQKGVDFGGDWGERAAAGKASFPLDVNGNPERVARFLTTTEAAALTHRLYPGRPGTIADWEKEAEAGMPASAASNERAPLWLSGGLPRGTLRDMLTVTGCKPAPDRLLVGLVQYRWDGRPSSVSIGERGLPQPCAQIAGPALGLSLGDAGTAIGAHDKQLIAIVPLLDGGPECAEVDVPAAPQRVDAGPSTPGKIREPRKVKNVAPVYPEASKSAGVQGTVVLEAVISPAGCIGALRVRRSVSPSLDAAAMVAVSQWRYTPTLLDGKPVPVMMTITVNFRLS